MAKHADYVVDQFMSLIQSSDSDAFKSINELIDPLYLEFLIIPHFNANSGLLADESKPNSALKFLKDCGELDRYEELKQFISLFKELMSQCMWLFKSVSGINSAIHLASKEPSYIDAKLDFTCWETVDFRMQALLTLYKSIAYDFNDRFVEILPINLRQFQMSIYTADVRILVNDADGKNFNDFGRTVDHLDVDITSRNHRMFHFGHCEFSNDSGTSHLSELSSTELSEVEIQFSIMYQTFYQSAKFRTLLGDYVVQASAKNIPINDKKFEEPDFLDKVKNKLGQSRIGFIANLSESYSKFEANANEQISVGKSVFSDTIDGKANQIAANLRSNIKLRNVFTDSDVDFFRNLDNYSVNRLINNLGNSFSK